MRCRYGDGTVRLTVEQDVLFPFIPNDKVEELRKEPIFQKYKIDPGNLERGLVSCTGAQVSAPAGPPHTLLAGPRYTQSRCQTPALPPCVLLQCFGRHTQTAEGCCMLDTCAAAWVQAVCNPPGTCVLLCWILT